MPPFSSFTAVAAPLPQGNIDTDMIIPAQFLRTTGRQGLGRNLFHGMRYLADGSENPDFVLNRPAYRASRILLTHENFGCGSSREHAPWALLEFGICCIVAPSFGEIFYDNCFKNGILPVRLPRPQCDRLIANNRPEMAGHRLSVDLERSEVAGVDGQAFPFRLDPHHRAMLLDGLDEIGRTLVYEDDIRNFERDHREAWPPLPETGFA